MLPCRRRFRQQLCAPALVAASLVVAPLVARAQSGWTAATPAPDANAMVARTAMWTDNGPGSPPPIELVAFGGERLAAGQSIDGAGVPGTNWISPTSEQIPAGVAPFMSDNGGWIAGPPGDAVYFDNGSPAGWSWQVLPDSIIYHSYMAGVHEPRFSVVMFGERDGRDLWDATLGGRIGVLRYGDTSCFRPQGWQLDFEGAAIMRFTLDFERDFETADYRAGVPLTYGVGDWQYKFAYYHLSSHMGDEFAIREDALDDRINYVRDAFVLGTSYFPHPYWRVYGEVAYAFKTDGGAEPWELQFGTELSRPGPTGKHGTPFFATNANLREEHDFGGDITAQVGWLWRGRENQTLRLGLHYFNGKSSQYQTFDDSEEQIGFGVWYDF